MTIDYEKSELYDFFGGQLHNYWPEEYGTWENAINDYLTQVNLHICDKIRKELNTIIELGLDEEILDQIIGDELNGNIYPPGLGMTYHEWLEKVLAMVEDWIKKKKDEQSS
jgi:hypothetical protein